MLRTVLWYAFVILRTLATGYNYLKVIVLDKQGKTAAAEEVTAATARNWARAAVLFSGSQVSVQGTENVPLEQSALFVANHQSYMDIAVLLGFVPGNKGFIAKIELAKIPLVSRWMERMHSLFLDRQNLRKSLLTMREAIKVLKDGHSLVIFPEGTRSKSNQVSEFKRGSLSIAEKAGVPVVPVAIIGSYKILEGNRGMRVCPAQIKVIIEKPLYPGDMAPGKDLATYVRDMISTHVQNDEKSFPN